MKKFVRIISLVLALVLFASLNTALVANAASPFSQVAIEGGGGSSAPRKNSVKILSYNLMTWKLGVNRNYSKIAEMLHSQIPDVICLQEVSTLQEGIISPKICKSNSAKGYNYTLIRGKYRGNTTGKTGDANECNPIYYNSYELNKIDSGTFWLYGNGESKAGKITGSEYNRICTWAVFETKDLKYFLVLNTHLDNCKNEKIRVKQAEIINNKAKEICNAVVKSKKGTYIEDRITEDLIAKQRIVIAGDFNSATYTSSSSTTKTELFNYMTAMAKYNDALATAATAVKYSYLKNTREYVQKNVRNTVYTCGNLRDIDHIFYTKGFGCLNYYLITETVGSDHNAIIANLSFK